MTRTIHGLQALSCIVFRHCWQQIEVIFVAPVVARDLPEVDVVEVWRLDLLEASPCILHLNQLYQLVVDYCSMGQEKCATCRVGSVPKEQILLLANQAMISFEGLFTHFQIVFHLTFVRERNPIDALKSFLV